MPSYLIVLLVILIIVAIIVFAAFFWLIRRTMTVAKKIDYLIEDITFKSESMKPVLDSLIAISTYFNTIEKIANQNINDIVNLFAKNNKEVQDIVESIKNIINNQKHSNLNKNNKLTNNNEKK